MENAKQIKIYWGGPSTSQIIWKEIQLYLFSYFVKFKMVWSGISDLEKQVIYER